MKNLKTVCGIIAMMAIIGILLGCPNPVDPEAGATTGSIAGKALFSDGANHSGILISLEKTGGVVSQSVRSAALSGRVAARAVAASTSTGGNGAYEFNSVAPGTYTIYASSRDSSEGAVTTSVVVTAGSRAVAADLQLTPVGSLLGRIKLDNGETGNLGFLVFLAGTSYMAITNDAGNFTISGVPAGSGYDVVIMKGSYTCTWITGQPVNGGAAISLGDKTVAGSDLDGSGAAGEMIWKGSFAVAPENPEQNWVYYNSADEKLYVYDNGLWVTLSQNSDSGDTGAMMIWKGSFAAAPENPEQNWVYYNSADEKLYVYDNGLWVTLSQNSDSGAMMIWKGSLAAAPENPEQNWVYYNSAVEELYVYDGGAWQALSQNNGDLGGMVIWKGSFATAPSSPQANWLYYNTTTEKLYLYDGGAWKALSQNNGDLGGMVIWKGSFASAPSSPQANWLYYNTTAEKLYLYDGGAWKALSQNNGDISGMMIWKGSLTTAPSSPQANWLYYNTAAEKLYLYDGGAWKVLSQNNGDISGMMIWKGSLATAPSSPKANWLYYNSADEKLYAYDGGAWRVLADNSDVYPAYGISLDKSGTQTFPAASFGYGAQAPLSVTVSNTGKQNTGALTLGLSGSGSDDFTLNESGVAGVAPGGTYTFTAVPKTGLAVGTYTALVTVDGANLSAQTLTLSFTVNAAPGYGIALDQTAAHTFTARSFGYGDQSAGALTVTITNTGNQNTGALTVVASPANIFTLSPASITGIGASGTAGFTVKPVTGLAAAAQPYTATVTVSGGANITSRSFDVSFMVNPASFSSAPSIDTVIPGTGSLKIDWSAAVPAPDSYKVYWKKGTHSDPAAVKTGPDNGSASGITALTYTISGLDGAAAYSVFVEALKTGYTASESAVLSEASAANFTGSLSLSVISLTANSLNYSVTSSGLSPSAVDSYDIYYMEGDQTVANVLSNNVKVNKTGAAGSLSLNPGAFYTVLAVAKKANYKDSNPSNAVNLVFSSTISLAGTLGQNETHGQGWSYADGVYTVLDGAELSVNGVTTSRRIRAGDGVTAQVTLNNAHITGITSGPAFALGTGANVTLTLAGTNELKTSTTGAAGLQTTGAALTIEGTGSLDAQGGLYGAGIGGGGSSSSNGGAGGSVTIGGSAVVTAQGGSGGAGIGGGGNIGGGSSNGGAGGSVTIGGSAVVTAQGGSFGAGIGGGGHGTNSIGGAGGSVTIGGSAVVTAQGGSFGAGIGGGGFSYSFGNGGIGGAGGSVTILGATVIARGGTSASGIGGGYNGSTGTITPPQNAVVFTDSAPGLTGNLANGISVGSAAIAFNGTYPSFATTVTLKNNMTVPAGATLTVPAGVNLNKSGYTVTGSVVNTGGQVFD
jgi:hypothetical protein